MSLFSTAFCMIFILTSLPLLNLWIEKWVTPRLVSILYAGKILFCDELIFGLTIFFVAAWWFILIVVICALTGIIRPETMQTAVRILSFIIEIPKVNVNLQFLSKVRAKHKLVYSNFWFESFRFLLYDFIFKQLISLFEITVISLSWIIILGINSNLSEPVKIESLQNSWSNLRLKISYSSVSSLI